MPPKLPYREYRVQVVVGKVTLWTTIVRALSDEGARTKAMNEWQHYLLSNDCFKVEAQ